MGKVKAVREQVYCLFRSLLLPTPPTGGGLTLIRNVFLYEWTISVGLPTAVSHITALLKEDWMCRSKAHPVFLVWEARFFSGV